MRRFLEEHEHAAPAQVERALAQLADAGTVLSYATFKVLWRCYVVSCRVCVVGRVVTGILQAYLAKEKAVRDTIESSGWASIYKDVLHLVFSRLDVVSLARCGRVCRHWHAVTASPALWEPHGGTCLWVFLWKFLISSVCSGCASMELANQHHECTHCWQKSVLFPTPAFST